MSNKIKVPPDILNKITATLGKMFFDGSYASNLNLIKGPVFINPDYAVANLKNKISQLKWGIGNRSITEFIFIMHARTDIKAFHLLHKMCQDKGCLCLTKGRIKFIVDGKASCPPTGSAIFYYGRNSAKFIEEFKTVGAIYKI